MEFPDDANLHNLSDQYLFGPEILVAPILDEGTTERIVYLPDGLWIDYWTDDLLRGPGSATVQAPLDKIPLFVRQGAIVPMGPDLQYSSGHPLGPLTLAIIQPMIGLLLFMKMTAKPRPTRTVSIQRLSSP